MGLENMSEGNDHVDVSLLNKLIALFFSVLAFIWVGFVIVFAQLILVPDMSFSDNGLIRFIGLLVCFTVAEKFYTYLIEDNNVKLGVLVSFILVFILTIVVGFLMI